jgi:hypothetical protein
MSIVPAGSTNLNAIGVPNVIVQIQPPSPLLNGVPTNIVGVVGTATYGPVNSPQPIGTLQELVNAFGAPQNALYDMGTQIYNAVQQGANDFVAIRVTDGTDVAASSNLQDVFSITGVVLTAKYTGSYGNTNPNVSGLQAVLSAGSTASTFKLTVYFLGGTPEIFDNIGGSGNLFWQNLASAVNLGQNSLRGPSRLVNASVSNAISSVTVTAAGSYATLPVLSTSGPGVGATLVPVMENVASLAVAIGSGYVVADTITLTGGTHTTASIVTVATVGLASAAINAAGTGYLPNDTITLAGGTETVAAVVKVLTVGGSGAVSTFSVVSSGSYTVAPVSFTQGSTSGSGSGATFNTLEFGVNTVTVSTAGSYTVLPANPVAQGTTSGSGVGATFNVSWGLLSVTVSAGGTGYSASSGLVVSGGGGSGALGTLVLTSGSSALPNLITYSFANGTNGNAGVTDATLIGVDAQTTINGVTYPRTGMYALRNTNASIGVLADQTDSSKWTSQVAFGLNAQIYMIGTMAAGYFNNISGSGSAVALKLASGVASYAFKLMMGDWVLISDPFNNVNRYVSSPGFVAGILATLDPSGSSLNKQMNGIVGTQKTQANQVYSDADLLVMLENGIDVVTSPIPLSPNAPVFGVRLGCNTSASITTNGDNYTRMINFLALTFNQGLGAFIGLPQTVTVQQQARNTLQTFLQNLVALGSIGTVNGSQAFRVVLDATNNPPNRVALGFMQADVTVTLLSIIQRFVINLQAGQSVQVQVLPAQLVA